MPERVSDSKQIQQMTVVRDVDGAAVDYTQERDRPAVLGQDHRALEIELDRRLRGDLGELLRGE
jgi:hypothetical protein